MVYDSLVELVLPLFAGALLGAILAGAFAVLWLLPRVRDETRAQVQDLSRREAEVAARERLQREREALETSAQSERTRVAALEERCRQREDALERRLVALEDRERRQGEREAALTGGEAALRAREGELERTLEREMRELERIGELRREEAQALLLDRIERRCREEAEQVVTRADQELAAELERRARDVLITALQRQAMSHAREAMVSVVPLPDEELKGLLIGRDARNLRTFEEKTGVDLLIDDTPGVVVLSAFDPVRREVARRALERLIAERRIHPPRIEAAVAEARSHLEEAVQELGREAAAAVGVQLPSELSTLIGRLEFCSSEGQNLRHHAIETAHLAATLASELGLDPGPARRAGLLHDVGKAVAHEREGGHAAVGAQLAERHGEDPLVVDAIAAHHGDVSPRSPYGVIVEIANRLSGQRPGARDAQLELAVRRQEALESAAARHPGVIRAYAVQAGREVRVVVDPGKVSDKAAQRLARDVAKALEGVGPSPGQVKVTVLRETRHEETSA